MTTSVLFACAITAIIIVFLCAMFIKPLKALLVLILNSALGWAGLYIFNKIFVFASFSIGINIATASITGVLGLPGLVLLCLVKIIYSF